MKKFLIIVICLIVLLAILGVIFFSIDYNRVKNGEMPLFCIDNPAGVYMDGGTREYFGLGYKVIKFNKLNGYKETKIGSWFMKLEDFDEEVEAYEKAPIYIYSAKEPEEKRKMSEENASLFRLIIGNLVYNKEESNDSMITYIIEDSNGTTYYLKSEARILSNNGKETKLDEENYTFLNEVINDTMGIEQN